MQQDVSVRFFHLDPQCGNTYRLNMELGEDFFAKLEVPPKVKHFSLMTDFGVKEKPKAFENVKASAGGKYILNFPADNVKVYYLDHIDEVTVITVNASLVEAYRIHKKYIEFFNDADSAYLIANRIVVRSKSSWFAGMLTRLFRLPIFAKLGMSVTIEPSVSVPVESEM
jgi:hypothetical protein